MQREKVRRNTCLIFCLGLWLLGRLIVHNVTHGATNCSIDHKAYLFMVFFLFNSVSVHDTSKRL